MNPRRIRGILLQELFFTMHSLESLFDVLVFPLVNIAIFGLISLYLTGNQGATTAHYVFLGMLLWQIISITSYSVAVGSMWNIWSRNLCNMFITPLQVKEYVFAQFASGCLKAVILLGLGAALSYWFFRFNVFDVGYVNLALVFLVFALFGLAVAMVCVGIVFRFGTRLAAFTWALPWFFQPLAAAFFPIDALPPVMRIIAYMLPPTYAFEAARNGLVSQTVDWRMFAIGTALGIVYCAGGIGIFIVLFAKSKDIGQFARNEG
jgi:ABC-2 type transport system permease protein